MCQTVKDDPFDYQPEKITVTISGVDRDVAKLRGELMSFLSKRFASVDFGYKGGVSQFFCYPFAVND